MRTTRTFKVSGLVVLAGALLAAVPIDGVRALGTIGCVFGIPVFAVSATRHLLRGLLWRVGSRLVMSYLLLLSAVVFAAFFVYAGLLVIAGQLGTRRVEVALGRRRAAVAALAHDLAPRLETARDAAARARMFAEAAAPSPAPAEIGMLWQPKGGTVETAGAAAAPDLAPRPWMTSRASVLAKSGGQVFAAAVEPRPAGTLVLTLRLHSGLRRELEKETGNIIRFHGAVKVTEEPVDVPKGGVRFTVDGRKKGKTTTIAGAPDSGGEKPESGETAAPPAGSGPWSARWTAFPLVLSEPTLEWETGRPLEGRLLLILVRTSLERESRALFGDLRVAGSQRLELSRVVLGVMGGLGIATIAVFAGASLLAGLLVYRIARATRRLSIGFAEIEKGNFAHRAVLKGHDQLAALVGSFNHMVERLSASVAARAEKEALEHELSVARDLQRRLLPPVDFACPGVEIAVDFAPAAAIGGDFYDLSYAGRVLTVSVADVSGHGLPTGLVMAAAKASLGMLARTGSEGVRLMELLHEEMVRTTERRTFVTLAHLVFDLAKGTVSYTNAGHPYPYRVRKDGTALALANPARPLGLTFSGGWHTVTEPLAAGDFWVVFSDGLVEATRGGTDGSDESWGFQRLEEVLRAGPAESAAALKDRILDAQRAFTRRTDTEDDRTLLVLRIDGSAGVVSASA
ncbi:MAG: SpoIIE family protein phosphatase [Thermoanaerobaculia bacterium]|nr:SpoIIE family protein phosphatase [Thermoanaerobaculia bacterium]